MHETREKLPDLVDHKFCNFSPISIADKNDNEVHNTFVCVEYTFSTNTKNQ